VTAARGRRRRVLAVLLLLGAWLLGGCVYFPNVREVGGVRFKPERGRLLRDGDGLVFSVELASTGKYGDTLLGASLPVARRAQLVSAAGPVERLEVPGESVVVFGPGGPRVEFSALTRPPSPGEVLIVTLHFLKYGNLGVISVVE
jgi:hypothetical protein